LVGLLIAEFTMYRVGDIRRKVRKRLKRRIIAMVVTIGVLALLYVMVFKNGMFRSQEGVPDTIVAIDTLIDSLPVIRNVPSTGKPLATNDTITKDTPIIPVYTDIVDEKTSVTKTDDAKKGVEKKSAYKQTPPENIVKEGERAANATSLGVGYKVNSTAYFFNEPNEATRRKAFVNHWNNSYATLKPTDEKNGFIYVVFTNHLGQTSRGWLRKKDLHEVSLVASDNRK